MKQAQHHGVIVLDLFGGMGAMLEGILRTGLRVISYRHCDIDNIATQVMRHRLVGLMMQYPSQLSTEATSDTFDTMPTDVQDIKTTQLEELVQQMITTQAVIFVAAGFPCQDLSAAGGSPKGLSGSRSGLFYPTVELIAEL